MTSTIGFHNQPIYCSETLFLLHWTIKLWLSEVRGFRQPPRCSWCLAQFWAVKQRYLTT